MLTNFIRPKTLQQLLVLAAAHIPRHEAEILLAHAAQVDQVYLIAHADEPASLMVRCRAARLFAQRQQGVPVAYLTGHKEFYGLDFFVNRHVLIPRPETELLVESVLNTLSTFDHSRRTTLIDVGAGSGCIPIAILKKTRKQEIEKAIAIDASRNALRVAKKNAKKHGVDITFLHGSLLQPLKNPELWSTNSEQILLTANLPYLTPEQYKNEPSIRLEPRTALVGGKSGLELYEELLKHMSSLNARSLVAFFEIDPSQSEDIKKMIHATLPHVSVDIKKDLCGRDRLVVIDARNTA